VLKWRLDVRSSFVLADSHYREDVTDVLNIREPLGRPSRNGGGILQGFEEEGFGTNDHDMTRGPDAAEMNGGWRKVAHSREL
jgi:hypothetical protein